MASVLIECLCKKIKDELGLDADPDTFRRTYIGCCMKDDGGWSWFMYGKGNNMTIGSPYTVSELVKKKYYLTEIIPSLGEVEILPELRDKAK